MKKTVSLILAIIIIIMQSLSLTISYADESWLWPVPSSTTINQYYTDEHDGLDIGGSYGCDVVATMSGTVVYSYYGDIENTYYGGGNFVVIRHSNGYYSHYAHLASRSVSEGQYVSQGQVIGTMGSTGNSTGTHLHFAIATRQYGSGGRINVNPDSISYSYSSSNDPQGVIDTVSGITGGVYVGGWAFDRDVPSQSIGIHVYIGGPAGSANAEGFALTTNSLRTDVNDVYGLTGVHGYSHRIYCSKYGSQPVYIYATNYGGGSNKLIGSRTVDIPQDTENPVISNVKTYDYSESGYKLSFTVTDNVKVKKVTCPTWTSYNSQDDITWHEVASTDGTNYIYEIKTADHNNELGNYVTHIYAYDCAGNVIFVQVGDVNLTEYTKPHSVSGYVGYLASPTATAGTLGSKEQLKDVAVTIEVSGETVTADYDNATGQFTFTNIPNGTYEASLTYAYGLPRTFTIVVDGADVVSDTVIGVLNCNFNSDKYVNAKDLAAFKPLSGKRKGSAEYTANYFMDINGDTYINAKDLAIFKRFSGKSTSNWNGNTPEQTIS